MRLDKLAVPVLAFVWSSAQRPIERVEADQRIELAEGIDTVAGLRVGLGARNQSSPDGVELHVSPTLE